MCGTKNDLVFLYSTINETYRMASPSPFNALLHSTSPLDPTEKYPEKAASPISKEHTRMDIQEVTHLTK